MAKSKNNLELVAFNWPSILSRWWTSSAALANPRSLLEELYGRNGRLDFIRRSFIPVVFPGQLFKLNVSTLTRYLSNKQVPQKEMAWFDRVVII